MFGDVWVLAGAPGAGKSFAASYCVQALSPRPALLDKDTVYGGFVEATLEIGDRPLNEREGSWWEHNIKRHEYDGLTATAREIRLGGCAVVVVAPFTEHMRNGVLWTEWTNRLGGGAVHLIWVRSDKATLLYRLQQRGLQRDDNKLADFDNCARAMCLDVKPVVPHIELDNRLGARISVMEQVQVKVAGASALNV